MNQPNLFDKSSCKHGREPNVCSLCNPSPRYVAGSDTSKAAADAIAGKAGSKRRQVLDFLVALGKRGATDNEMQIGLGMPGSTQRPRRIELRDAALIVSAGTRDGCTVWVAVQSGER